MSFDKVSCVTVTCDLCRDDFEPGDYLIHYDNEGEAKEMLGEYGWNSDGPDVWCDNCFPHCICGHSFGEHDYGDGPCEDGDCSVWRRDKNE